MKKFHPKIEQKVNQIIQKINSATNDDIDDIMEKSHIHKYNYDEGRHNLTMEKIIETVAKESNEESIKIQEYYVDCYEHYITNKNANTFYKSIDNALTEKINELKYKINFKTIYDDVTKEEKDAIEKFLKGKSTSYFGKTSYREIATDIDIFFMDENRDFVEYRTKKEKYIELSFRIFGGENNEYDYSTVSNEYIKPNQEITVFFCRNVFDYDRYGNEIRYIGRGEPYVNKPKKIDEKKLKIIKELSEPKVNKTEPKINKKVEPKEKETKIDKINPDVTKKETKIEPKVNKTEPKINKKVEPKEKETNIDKINPDVIKKETKIETKNNKMDSKINKKETSVEIKNNKMEHKIIKEKNPKKDGINKKETTKNKTEIIKETEEKNKNKKINWIKNNCCTSCKCCQQKN